MHCEHPRTPSPPLRDTSSSLQSSLDEQPPQRPPWKKWWRPYSLIDRPLPSDNPPKISRPSTIAMGPVRGFRTPVSDAELLALWARSFGGIPLSRGMGQFSQEDRKGRGVHERHALAPRLGGPNGEEGENRV